MTLKEHLGAVAGEMAARGERPEEILLTQLYLIYCAKDGRMGDMFREVGHEQPYTTLDRMVHGLTTTAARAFFDDDDMVHLDVSLLHETFSELLNRGSRTGSREVGHFFQPDELTEFAYALSGYKEGMSVYNPYSGIASYAGLLRAGNNYHGEERSRLAWAIGTLNMWMEETPSDNYILGNSLEEKRWDKPFDLVISTPPTGQVRRQGTRAGTTYPEIIMSKASELLADGGTMVVVCPAATLKDRFARMLVDCGMLDTVVFLPRELRYSAPYRSAVVRLRKGRNPDEPVTLVDGVDFSAPGGRVNILRSDDLLKAMEDRDPSYVISVSPATLKENGYMIVPVYYVAPNRKKERNSAPLSSLGRFISPHYTLTEPSTAVYLRDLHDLSDRSTGVCSLSVMPSPVVKQPVKGAGRYFRKLETRALLISATHTPVRMGTVNASPEHPVYLAPYIHVFVPDEDKVSAEYIALQLSKAHELGSGSSVFRLRSDELESFQIPLIPKGEQDALVLREMRTPTFGPSLDIVDTSPEEETGRVVDVVLVGHPEFPDDLSRQISAKRTFTRCREAGDWLSGNPNAVDAVIALHGDGIPASSLLHLAIGSKVPVYFLSDKLEELQAEFAEYMELLDGHSFPTGSEDDLLRAVRRMVDESRTPAGMVRSLYARQLEAAGVIDGLVKRDDFNLEEKLISILLPENADRDWFADLRLIRDERFLKILIDKGFLPPVDGQNFTLGAEMDLVADRIYSTNRTYMLTKPIVSPDLGRLIKATKDLINKPHHESGADDTPRNLKMVVLHVVMELICTLADMIDDGLFDPGRHVSPFWSCGQPDYESDTERSGVVKILKDRSTPSNPYYYMGNIHLAPAVCRSEGIQPGDRVSLQSAPDTENNPVWLDYVKIIFYSKKFKKIPQQ